MRTRLALALVLTAAVLAGGAVFLYDRLRPAAGRADPADAQQVALGRRVYAAHCAACHGDRLQGQPDWQTRKADGRLPAPPHDASGHTWHHADRALFDITKHGLAPFVPRGYRTDMPAYESVLSDAEIWAVLAFIKSSWPPEIRERQAAISARTAR